MISFFNSVDFGFLVSTVLPNKQVDGTCKHLHSAYYYTQTTYFPLNSARLPPC